MSYFSRKTYEVSQQIRKIPVDQGRRALVFGLVGVGTALATNPARDLLSRLSPLVEGTAHAEQSRAAQAYDRNHNPFALNSEMQREATRIRGMNGDANAKLQEVFRVVSARITNSEAAGRAPRDATETWTNRNGDCSEEAAVFIGMLRGAGFIVENTGIQIFDMVRGQASIGNIRLNIPTGRPDAIAYVMINGSKIYLRTLFGETTTERMPWNSQIDLRGNAATAVYHAEMGEHHGRQGNNAMSMEAFEAAFDACGRTWIYAREQLGTVYNNAFVDAFQAGRRVYGTGDVDGACGYYEVARDIGARATARDLGAQILNGADWNAALQQNIRAACRQ
ncbi:MAG: transglutaminase domain-containing protein [Candidatus Micrarchaeota archaeon]